MTAPDARGWDAYYRVTGARPPRPTLIEALDRFATERTGFRGFAIDLGCGSGRDTVEILRRGWHVLGIDSHPAALEALRARAASMPGDANQHLETRLAGFGDPGLALPDADLINSSFALPGCPPDRFPVLWRRIVAALRPGARFSGQLYGDRDSWVAKHPGMTFVSRTRATELLSPLTVELFDEEETDSVTPRGEAKRWHIFHIVAQKSP